MGGKQQSLLTFFRPIDPKIPKHDAISVSEGDGSAVSAKKSGDSDVGDTSVAGKDTQSESHVGVNLSEEMNDFERERLERIERNREIMKTLGLGFGGNAMPNMEMRKVKKKARVLPRKRDAVAVGPVRRSSRRLKGEGCVESLMGKENCEIGAEEEMEHTPSPGVFQERASLIQYMCSGEGIPKKDVASCSTEGPLNSFKEMYPNCFDSKLVRTYSVDYFHDGQGRLVAAGGKNGHCSIFACSQSLHSDEEANDVEPLISQKLHKGWISDVVFMSRDEPSSRPPLLLTAGNDGIVSIWDTALEEETSGNMKQLHMNDSFHTSGIFSMDYQKISKKILTGSKDGSICVSCSTDAASGLRLLHRLDGVHDDHVVKCVKWNHSDSNVFLSCGNDGATKIHDARSYSWKMCHTASNVVNTLLWNPSDGNLFLSAGSSSIHIQDIRKESSVISEIRGHNDQGNSGIYQPLFVNKGAHVLTAGSSKDSQYLNLFTLTGEIVSRGSVGYSVGASYYCSEDDMAIFSGPRKLAFFKGH
jgi:hypothetical protein